MKIKALENIKPNDIILIEDVNDRNHSIVTVSEVFPSGLVIKEFGQLYVPANDKQIVVLGSAKHKHQISLLNKTMDRRISKL